MKLWTTTRKLGHGQQRHSFWHGRERMYLSHMPEGHNMHALVGLEKDGKIYDAIVFDDKPLWYERPGPLPGFRIRDVL